MVRWLWEERALGTWSCGNMDTSPLVHNFISIILCNIHNQMYSFSVMSLFVSPFSVHSPSVHFQLCHTPSVTFISPVSVTSHYSLTWHFIGPLSLMSHFIGPFQSHHTIVIWFTYYFQSGHTIFNQVTLLPLNQPFFSHVSYTCQCSVMPCFISPFSVMSHFINPFSVTAHFISPFSVMSHFINPFSVTAHFISPFSVMSHFINPFSVTAHFISPFSDAPHYFSAMSRSVSPSPWSIPITPSMPRMSRSREVSDDGQSALSHAGVDFPSPELFHHCCLTHPKLRRDSQTYKYR